MTTVSEASVIENLEDTVSIQSLVAALASQIASEGKNILALDTGVAR